MNVFGKILLFFLSVVPLSGSIAQDNGLENEVRRRLVNGLANAEPSVFEEARRLPISQAAPLLLPYVDDASTNRERAEQARAAVRSIPGFAEYMKGRLLEKRILPGGEYQMQEFRLLDVIGGNEAAAAVAPFLFVDDPPLLMADDFSAGQIKYDALNALRDMHLEGAPKGGLAEWRAWAENKGFHDPKIPPLITLEQKGVSVEAIARSNAIMAGGTPDSAFKPTDAGVVPRQTSTPIPTPTQPVSTPTVSPSSSPRVLGPIDKERAVPESQVGSKATSSTGLVLLGATIGIVVVIVAYLRLSRNSG